MEPTQQQPYGLGRWLSQSVTAKLIFIGILSLLLLIPSTWVSSLVQERQHRQQQVVADIGRSWSAPQVIGGPVLVLPYKTMVKRIQGEVETLEERIQHLYLLPDELKIDVDTDTELLHRGIFDAVVYQAHVRMEGHFGPVELLKAELKADQVLWDKARMAVGVGDLRGLKDNPTFDIGGTSYLPETDYASIGVFGQNLVVAPALDGKPDTSISFRFVLDIKGSQGLHFLQLAKSTDLAIKGNWASPKFEGQFLPETREVTANGFNATWKVPHFSRQIPQQWVSAGTTIQQAWAPESETDVRMYEAPIPAAPAAQAHSDVRQAESFGLQFLQPVDHYKKAERTAKYAILIILLTFVSLFFTEVITKKRVHIIQYLLIGAAMIVYYCLLLSLAEFVGFNMAYAIASGATIALIGVFIAQLLRQRKMALLFSGILAIFYGFIFVIIQLQDMALLFGSVGLFITVALLMYFSGKINWQREEA